MLSLSMGDRIRQARKAQKLTQGELAEKIGLSMVTLNRFENGRRTPSADALARLTKALNCDFNWIVTGEVKQVIGELRGADAEELQVREDLVLQRIIKLLEHDLPEAKEQILKILEGRKLMQEGFNALSLTRS